MEATLKDLAPGEFGKIIKVTATGALRRRLFDMGLTPGAEVFMRKTAPLGDPIEINLRGYELSIRKADAAEIILEKRP